MENMRAYMLVQQIQDVYPEVRHIPEKFEGDDEIAQRIIQDGLTLLVDDEVIAMVNELDNLIVDIQAGVKIKKESKGE
jgi:hypothetical protein